jgi:hypothetical protein
MLYYLSHREKQGGKQSKSLVVTAGSKGLSGDGHLIMPNGNSF